MDTDMEILTIDTQTAPCPWTRSPSCQLSVDSLPELLFKLEIQSCHSCLQAELAQVPRVS